MASSLPLVIDSTAPRIFGLLWADPTIYGPFGASLSFQAQDPETEVVSCEAVLGTAPHSGDTAGPTAAHPSAPGGDVHELVLRGTLQPGVLYYATVACTNRVGLTARATSIPLAPDGRQPGPCASINATATPANATANATGAVTIRWDCPSPTAHVAGYRVGLGTRPGATDLLAMQPVGASPQGAVTLAAPGLGIAQYHARVDTALATGAVHSDVLPGLAGDVAISVGTLRPVGKECGRAHYPAFAAALGPVADAPPLSADHFSGAPVARLRG